MIYIHIFKDGADYLGGIDKFIDELNSYYDKGKPLSSRNDTLDEYGNVVKGYNPPYLVAFYWSYCRISNCCFN